MSAEVLLKAGRVAKSFGRRTVLTDANVVVHRGELVGITGENGSGKTTLLKILGGILRADRGEVAHHGRLGYCPQEPLVFDRLRMVENFCYFAAAYGLSDWESAMAHWVELFRLERHTRSLAGELSAGMRQKLNLALALLHQPDVLLLDEPYAAFDWETYLRFWELADSLRAEGRGLIVVSHFVYDESKFDRVCELSEGVLACD